MYIVLVYWDGDVTYGVDTASYLIGIFEKEEDAVHCVREWSSEEPLPGFKFTEYSFQIPTEREEDLYEKYGICTNEYDSGAYTVVCKEFVPGMCVGGGWYRE